MTTILKNRDGLAVACPNCGAFEVEAGATETMHHGRWECLSCNAFRGWIPKPENVAKQQTQDQLIDRLLESGRVTGWELMFLRSVKQTRKRSNKQLEKVRQIGSRLGLTEEVKS